MTRLTISGEKRFSHEINEDQFHRIERRYGTFSRSFSLPSSIDATKISAEHKNGVLTVRLPPREEAKPGQIKVDVRSHDSSSVQRRRDQRDMREAPAVAHTRSRRR